MIYDQEQRVLSGEDSERLMLPKVYQEIIIQWCLMTYCIKGVKRTDRM